MWVRHFSLVGLCLFLVWVLQLFYEESLSLRPWVGTEYITTASIPSQMVSKVTCDNLKLILLRPSMLKQINMNKFQPQSEENQPVCCGGCLSTCNLLFFWGGLLRSLVSTSLWRDVANCLFKRELMLEMSLIPNRVSLCVNGTTPLSTDTNRWMSSSCFVTFCRILFSLFNLKFSFSNLWVVWEGLCWE